MYIYKAQGQVCLNCVRKTICHVALYLRKTVQVLVINLKCTPEPAECTISLYCEHTEENVSLYGYACWSGSSAQCHRQLRQIYFNVLLPISRRPRSLVSKKMCLMMTQYWEDSDQSVLLGSIRLHVLWTVQANNA